MQSASNVSSIGSCWKYVETNGLVDLITQVDLRQCLGGGEVLSRRENSRDQGKAKD